MGYRQIDHTADVGLIISADSLSALFDDAARGMFSLIVEGDAPGAVETRSIRIAADDREGLLVDWLRELLYLWNDEKRRFVKTISWQETDNTASAIVQVERCDPSRHAILCEIKAVTYHQVAVETDGRNWTARVIFDV